jgi:hypothetical protein
MWKPNWLRREYRISMRTSTSISGPAGVSQVEQQSCHEPLPWTRISRCSFGRLSNDQRSKRRLIEKLIVGLAEGNRTDISNWESTRGWLKSRQRHRRSRVDAEGELRKVKKTQRNTQAVFCGWMAVVIMSTEASPAIVRYVGVPPWVLGQGGSESLLELQAQFEWLLTQNVLLPHRQETLYPRYEVFSETKRVCEKFGREAHTFVPRPHHRYSVNVCTDTRASINCY